MLNTPSDEHHLKNQSGLGNYMAKA